MLGAQWNRTGSIGLRCQALERIWRQVNGADAPGHDCLSPGLPTHVFLDRIRDSQRLRRT